MTYPQNNINTTIKVRSNGRKYTVRHNRDRFFYPEEWNRFYGKIKSMQKKTFDCLISTGARINEMRNVMKQDHDFMNNRIILRVTKIKAKKKEKNPRPRTIPLSTQFNKRLKAYFKDNAAIDYIGILSTPAANIAMKKALQKAGVNDWQMFSIHNIRKTFEIWLMALGIDGLKITAHMGHSLGIAASNYVSPDIFSSKERMMIREIIGDLYQNRY